MSMTPDYNLSTCFYCGTRLDSSPREDCPDPAAHEGYHPDAHVRHPRSYCTNPAHGYGEHDASCMPPADPDNPELRLIRAIFGLCSLCDRTEDHEHTDEELLAHGMLPDRGEGP